MRQVGALPVLDAGCRNPVVLLRLSLIVALATMVFTILVGHPRPMETWRTTSLPRTPHAARAAACRFAGPRAAMALTHRVRPWRDGSARAAPGFDGGKVEIEDDLGDGLQAPYHVADEAALAIHASGDSFESAFALDDEAHDPSRFAAGRGLPRGPPA